MKQAAVRVVVAVAISLLAAPAVAQQPTGPKERGFALEVHLGARVTPVDMDANLATPYVDGGFFAGYKLGRFMIGGSLEYARLAHDPDVGEKTSVDRLLVMPGVRVAILRSADERVELYGQADIGFGHAWVSHEDGAHVVAFQVGPGLRLWFHPNFAAAAMVGLRGEHFIFPHDSIGFTGIYASLAFTGVF